MAELNKLLSKTIEYLDTMSKIDKYKDSKYQAPVILSILEDLLKLSLDAKYNAECLDYFERIDKILNGKYINIMNIIRASLYAQKYSNKMILE